MRTSLSGSVLKAAGFLIERRAGNSRFYRADQVSTTAGQRAFWSNGSTTHPPPPDHVPTSLEHGGCVGVDIQGEADRSVRSTRHGGWCSPGAGPATTRYHPAQPESSSR